MKKIILVIFIIFSIQKFSFNQTYRWNNFCNNVPCNIQTMLTNVKYYNDKLYIINGSKGSIYISTNKGNSFETVNIDTTNNGFYNFQIKDASKMWLLRSTDGVLLKSSNSGYNWIYKGSIGVGNFNITRVLFINDQTGYVMGYNGSFGDNSCFFKTTNSGNNFTSISLPTYFKLGFDFAIPDSTNTNKIYASWDSANYGKFWISTNAGLNWTSMYSNVSIYKMFFNSPNKAWTCGSGGKIFYFDGSNLIQQNSGISGTLQSISFCNDGLHGWAVGPGSTIMKTSNSGQTWLKDSVNGVNVFFYDVFAVSPTEAYAVGGPRVFYKYGLAVGVNNILVSIPDKYELYQNYPNPFNPTTSIKYSVSSIRNIKLIIYDIRGKEVTTLVNEKQTPGMYEVTFDGSQFPSGVFFCKLSIDNVQFSIRKMMLLK